MGHAYEIAKWVEVTDFEQGLTDHWEIVWQGDDGVLALENFLSLRRQSPCMRLIWRDQG